MVINSSYLVPLRIFLRQFLAVFNRTQILPMGKLLSKLKKAQTVQLHHAPDYIRKFAIGLVAFILFQ